MQVAMRIDPDADDERRYVYRLPSFARAVVRRLKAPQEDVHLADISCQGCGFFSKWPLPVGAKVWLNLPGLESWAATVAWYEDGRGGLRFERNLHPLVAQRYAAHCGSER